MDFMDIVWLALAAAVGLLVGALVHKSVTTKRIGDADELAKRIVEEARKEAQAQKKEILCVGPSEAGLSKAKDRYRYTLYLKSTEDAELEQVKEYLEQQIHTQPWAHHCTVQFDRNPMSSY